MALGRLSLAEQIAQLEEAAPVDYDPEDLQSRGVEDDTTLRDSNVREHYFEVGPSTLRNRFPSVADPKYEGVRASRKQLLEDLEEFEEDESDKNKGRDGEGRDEEDQEEDDMDSEDQHAGSSFDKSRDHLFERRLPSAGEESGEDSEHEDKDMASNHTPGEPSAGQKPTEDMASTMQKTRENDIKKGQAVKRQIALWDTLLDTRIRLQKSVVSVNSLPPPSQMREYFQTSDCRNAITKFLDEASMLTDELSELQESILTINDVIQPPPRKRRKLDEEPSINQYGEVLASATQNVIALEEAFHPYLLQTLSKWSSKIQAVAPSVLLPSNRGAFSKGGQNLKSVVQLIDETLQDHNKLLMRTQVLRVKKPRIGVPHEDNDDAAEVADPEIFDDTDFYQKILRDIIGARGNGGKEDWTLMQKQKKSKKKVDTKASKGRKLRYEAHEKLQNFMVPVPVPGAWHEEQVDELFASLLGKGFEHSTLNAEEPQVQQGIALGGFRVFG